MNEPVTLGFGHFIAQSDMVSKVLLGILVLMSIVSWALIVSKGISQMLRSRSHTSKVSGLSAWRRAKARSWPVSLAARPTVSEIAST